MYTLVIEKKESLRYMLLAVFCLLFDIIYEHFSYGEYSWAMRMMFLFPLLGGAGLAWLLRGKSVKTWSARFWKSGLAVFTVGCLVHGIIVISGRSSSYDWVYVIAGIVFCILSIFCQMKSKTSLHRKAG